MASVSLTSSYRESPSFRRRAVGLLVAVAANLLLVLMLLRLASGAMDGPAQRGPVTIQLLPEQTPTREKTATQQKKAGKKTAATHRPTPPPQPKAEAQPPAAPVGPLKMVVVSPEVFRASDISKIPRQPTEDSQASAQSADASAGSAGDSSSDGPGTGPHGERLYNAEWVREPTHAELAYYLPSNPPSEGWALIACRTTARFHVEDCTEIGDSPPGSGLARAMRQAAWQFLVRPPRVGGRPMVGEWVRIRIDFTRIAER